MAKSERNVAVETAVNNALERIDAFISGSKLEHLPQADHRRACDELLLKKSASVGTAALFLAFYWQEDQTWDLDILPIGVRGEYGDKKLCEELTNRSITLHKSITAYGENLGWKGNVSSGTVRLREDNRFKDFLDAVAGACDDPDEITRVADYLAWRFADSKKEPTPLPPVGADVLTAVRARVLFHLLLGVESEGHIQQFLVAALLFVYRSRHNLEIRTHHPHAADKFDKAAGDIEEFHEGRLVRAYDVTVRDDWKIRLSNFKRKMDSFKLPKFVIIAGNVNDDDEWSVPATMALKIEKYERDIAVLDITDVLNFLVAELNPTELRAAVMKAFEYLSDRKLCGREDIKEMYFEAVQVWLDAASPVPKTKKTKKKPK